MVYLMIDRLTGSRIWPQRRFRLSRRSLLVLVTVVMLSTGTISAYLWYRGLERQYHDVKLQADAFRLRYETGSQQLGLGDLPQLTEDLTELEGELRGLQDRIDVPLVSSIARHAPYGGERYRAVEDLLDLSVELTSIARAASEIANEARMTLEASGIRATDAESSTWLDVVVEREDEIRALEARFQQSLQLREQIDDDALPERGLAALLAADHLIEKTTRLRDEYFDLLPLLAPAFGRDQDAHYLILLQNGEEIRPSGGFPGTFGLLTIRNGQIVSLEIDDIRTLDWAYHDNRATPILSPGPIRTYLRQEEWLPHDALWSPDFAESAQAFLSMYNETGWPELTGIIGVNHSVLESVLTSVGAYDVTLNGESQTVGPDNFLEVIESHRDLTWQDLAVHKRVVGVLGAALLDRIAAADFETKKAMYFGLRADADRREIQVYMLDPDMQLEVVERHWHGPLVPDSAVPTLALTVASVAGGKSSTKIVPQSHLTLQRDPATGNLVTTWLVRLEHHGDPGGDPTYHGFQRLWVSVYLPAGAQNVTLSREPDPSHIADDARALGFNIGIMPGTTEELQIAFELPGDAGSILLRRQPGLNDTVVFLTMDLAPCQLDTTWTATTDLRLNLQACEVQYAR